MNTLSNPTESARVKSRILIVDDEPAVCTLLTERLCAQGFECRAANSGSEAISILETERFDALICDLRMRGISGLSLLETARTKCPWMSFLIATGVENVRLGVDAMKQGADDYILKPFRLERVVIAVDRALEKKRLELEVEAYRERLEDMVTERTEQLRTVVTSLQQTYDETLKALADALAMKDTETREHTGRVAHYSLKIAKAANCTPEQVVQILRGSYLHDIGKIGIPDAILKKPGKLTPEEFAVMQTHSRIGYEFVCHIPFLTPAAEIVLAHHEWFDGTGYPRGLKGNNILFGARIVAVANAFDVMVNDQPYRRAGSFDDAFDEIRRCSGTQFDPKVVAAFFAVPQEVWKEIRRELVQGRRQAPLPESRTK